jgi:hypothetical protein
MALAGPWLCDKVSQTAGCFKTLARVFARKYSTAYPGDHRTSRMVGKSGGGNYR